MSITVGARMIAIPVSRWDGPEEAGEFRFALPSGWRYLEEHEPLATAFAHPNGLRAMLSVMIEQDERRWLHVSISRHDRMPSYGDLCLAKRDLIGRFRKAIQVFAPESEHVSHHPYCLHLWCCLDDDGLPDFTRGNRMI